MTISGDQLADGAHAVRSRLRFGGWIVRGVDGYFEVAFEVDEVTRVLRLGAAEVEAYLAGCPPEDLRELLPLSREDVARKCDLSRYAEVLAATDISVKWGSTSDNVGGASFTSPDQLDAFHAAREGRLSYVLSFTPRPGVARRPDRLSTLLDAVNTRAATVSLTVGAQSGMLIAAPGPFAGQPYALATFDGDRLAGWFSPFGATILDTLKRELGERELVWVPLSDGARRELVAKADRARWGDVLATEDVVLITGYAGGPERVFTEPAQARDLVEASSGAFLATIRFVPREARPRDAARS